MAPWQARVDEPERESWTLDSSPAWPPKARANQSMALRVGHIQAVARFQAPAFGRVKGSTRNWSSGGAAQANQTQTRSRTGTGANTSGYKPDETMVLVGESESFGPLVSEPSASERSHEEGVLAGTISSNLTLKWSLAQGSSFQFDTRANCALRTELEAAWTNRASLSEQFELSVCVCVFVSECVGRQQIDQNDASTNTIRAGGGCCDQRDAPRAGHGTGPIDRSPTGKTTAVAGLWLTRRSR